MCAVEPGVTVWSDPTYLVQLLSCVLAGTPAWMAPEIINGEPESQAVDVYSLGVVMWELVTGRRPFDGVSVRAR